MRGRGFVFADEDVSAPGPILEIGAGVRGYSGGFAACVSVSDLNSCDWIRDGRSVRKRSICFCMSDSAEFNVTDTGYAH